MQINIIRSFKYKGKGGSADKYNQLQKKIIGGQRFYFSRSLRGDALNWDCVPEKPLSLPTHTLIT